MLRAASTYVFIKQRLHPGLLDQLARGGAEGIEIFGARGHFDYADRGHVREIAAWFQSSGLKFNSMHSPMHGEGEWRDDSSRVNIVDQEKRRRIESMDEIKRAIEVAEVAPFRFLVQHVGTGGERFDPRKFEAAITAIEHLRAFARPLGVTLLVENIPNELSEPDKLVELLDTAHFDDVGVCFDFGHAHIMSSVPEAFGILKPRIRSTHVHDNARDRDAHLWPGEGSIDWNVAMGLLRSAPHVPPLLLEIEGDEKRDVAKKTAEAFGRLEEALAASAKANENPH
jgi:sugar phosphate isomerase/epimerase